MNSEKYSARQEELERYHVQAVNTHLSTGGVNEGAQNALLKRLRRAGVATAGTIHALQTLVMDLEGGRNLRA
jgi:hypothetical protein